jgi:hypothetical protein
MNARNMLRRVTDGALWLWRPFALAEYRKKLGPHLARLYGARDSYGIAQVKSGIVALGLPEAYTSYGVAMYCSLDDFERFNRSMHRSENYVTLRVAGFGLLERRRRTDPFDGGGGFPDTSDHCSAGDGHGGDGCGGGDGGGH